jgi:hypothetical protein
MHVKPHKIPLIPRGVFYYMYLSILFSLYFILFLLYCLLLHASGHRLFVKHSLHALLDGEQNERKIPVQRYSHML